METALPLLMRDGAIHVIFHPRLTPRQYGELALVIEKAATKADLCEALEAFACHWGIEVDFEE